MCVHVCVRVHACVCVCVCACVCVSMDLGFSSVAYCVHHVGPLILSKRRMVERVGSVLHSA